MGEAGHEISTIDPGAGTGSARQAGRAEGADEVRAAHRRAPPPAPHTPAVGASRAAFQFRRRNVCAGLPGTPLWTDVAFRDPCVLVVEFRLRLVRGRGHALFRWESLLNTPLFVGFPGFVSKLWMTCDERGRYRGIYEWAGPQQAEDYARALWRVLALVSVPGSIGYQVLPGLHRSDLPLAADGLEWWRPVEIS